MNICTVDIETEDIPSTGILSINKIFCIAVKWNEEPTKVFTYLYHPKSAGNLKAALNLMNKADLIVGHNFIKFDKIVIENLVGSITTDIADTFLDSKLMYTKDTLFDIDWGITNMPKNLYASYSLEAWGHRFYDYKIQYNDFSCLNDDMIEYCIQDVDLTYKVYKYLSEQAIYPSKKVRDLEYTVAYILAIQQTNGFYFDIDSAREFMMKLRHEKLNLELQLTKVFRPKFFPDGPVVSPAKARKVKIWEPNPNYEPVSIPPMRYIRQYERDKHGRPKIPKNKYKWFTEPHQLRYSYIEGEYQKIKLTKFNPGSRQQIIDRLSIMYGWEPEIFTEKATPKVDAELLKSLDYPEAALLRRYLKIVKDLSQLSETDNSLIAHYNPKTHCIHGGCDNLGTVTRRAAHSSPNLGQIPKKDASKGQDGEFRKLFTVPEGYSFVGSDASSLELKILAHYLYPYDGGAYDNAIEKGNKADGTDPHSLAQKAMGLSSRDEAKTATYAILYGASGPRVGWSLLKDKPNHIVDYTYKEFTDTKEKMLKRCITIEGLKFFPIASDMFMKLTDRLIEQAIYGNRVIDGFRSNLTGFSDMIKDMKESMIDGKYIQAVDGGLITVRSDHSLLNLFLQSAGSIAVKYWMVEVHRQLANTSLINGVDYMQMAYIHDELDFISKTECAETVAKILSASMKQVKEQLNLNVDLTADYMIGDSWYSCH